MPYTVRVGLICRWTDITTCIREISVETGIEAQKIIQDFQKKECFENWEFLGGELKEKNGNLLGIFSEHGGFFGAKNVGNKFYEKLPDFSVRLGIP
jgi:hypothetical protein